MKNTQHKSDIDSLSYGEKLKLIRQKCLNSKHPLRWLHYLAEEQSYMNERNNIK